MTILIEKNQLEDAKGFIEWLKNKELSARTIFLYLYYHKHFNGFHNLSQEKVDSFFIYYHKDNIARAFIKNYLSFLSRYGHNFGVDETMVRLILLPERTGHKSQRVPKTINEEELWNIEKHMTNERNKIMLFISFYCGLRLAELLGIKPYDFLWNSWEKNRERAGKLKVIGKGDRERIVFVPSSLMKRIYQWIATEAVKQDNNPNNPLFKIGKRRWEKILEVAAKRALNKGVNPHMLRHSHATNMHARGLKIEEIKELLGHASISTTQIYLHMNKKELEERFNQIGNC